MLRRRLGLDGDQRLTLGALGAEYGLSRERIRQLQVRQLRQLAWRTGRCRRGAVLREVIRGLADGGGQSPGAAIDEIAGLVFPEAAPELRLPTVAVLAGYPARVRDKLAAEAAQAREQRTAARREQAALARAGKPLRRLLAAVRWPPEPAVWPGDGRGEYQRTREVRDWEHSGQFPSAKLGRAVAYESGLEHRFLRLCEDSLDVTWYQEQPACGSCPLGLASDNAAASDKTA